MSLRSSSPSGMSVSWTGRNALVDSFSVGVCEIPCHFLFVGVIAFRAGDHNKICGIDDSLLKRRGCRRKDLTFWRKIPYIYWSVSIHGYLLQFRVSFSEKSRGHHGWGRRSGRNVTPNSQRASAKLISPLQIQHVGLRLNVEFNSPSCWATGATTDKDGSVQASRADGLIDDWFHYSPLNTVGTFSET
jgi:hypothetical protein